MIDITSRKRKRKVGKQKRIMKQIQVAAAIIEKEGKVFATQKSYGKFEGIWEFPGGKIESGETPEEALIREIREELDTDIQVKECFMKQEYEYPDFQVVLHFYFCDIARGELRLLEHKAARWLGADELDSVSWMPANMDMIAKLKTYLS